MPKSPPADAPFPGEGHAPQQAPDGAALRVPAAPVMPDADLGTWPTLAWLLVLSLLALVGLDPYLYGLYNHNITVPFLARTLDPTAFPADPLVDQLDYFYSYFLRGLALTHEATGWSFERLFLVGQFLSLFGSLWAMHGLAFALTGRKDAALGATALLAIGLRSLAQVWTLEPIFMERSLALPLQLWALERMLRGRWWSAFALAGLSFPIHPLSAAYAGFIVGFTALVRQTRRPGVWLGGGLLFLLGAAPSLYLKFTQPSPELPMFHPDGEWLRILRLHSDYHVFPFSWPLSSWLRAAAFVVATGFALKGGMAGGLGAGSRPAAAGQPNTPAAFRRAGTALLAILLLGLIGTLFTEIVPLTLPLQFQFWRGFRFFFYIGFAFLAALALRSASGQTSRMYALPVLVLALVAWTGIARHLTLGAAAVMAVLLFGPALLERLGREPRKAHSPAALAVLLLLVAGTTAGYSLKAYGFSAESRAQAEWVDAQHWARDNTAADAAFIVPPAEWGWRVESRRTSYGDWYDGTQNFFDAGYGRLWLARMENLGYNGNEAALPEAYRALPPEAFARAAQAFPEDQPVYVVQYADAAESSATEGLETVYQNPRYHILRWR